MWDSMGFNKIVNILVFVQISTNKEHLSEEIYVAR